jgi:hypothetical protein
MTQITLRINDLAQEQKLMAFLAQEGIEILPTAEQFYGNLQASVEEYKLYKKGKLQPATMQDFLTELKNA